MTEVPAIFSRIKKGARGVKNVSRNVRRISIGELARLDPVSARRVMARQSALFYVHVLLYCHREPRWLEGETAYGTRHAVWRENSGWSEIHDPWKWEEERRLEAIDADP